MPHTEATVSKKTLGEMEAAVGELFRHFEMDHMGRGPKDIQTYLIGDLLVIRLTGTLTAVEQHLAQSLPVEKGRDLIKQIRTHLIETARPILEHMIRDAIGVAVLSLHHDVSTVTGERIIVITLVEPPDFREVLKR